MLGTVGALVAALLLLLLLLSASHSTAVRTAAVAAAAADAHLTLAAACSRSKYAQLSVKRSRKLRGSQSSTGSGTLVRFTPCLNQHDHNKAEHIVSVSNTGGWGAGGGGIESSTGSGALVRFRPCTMSIAPVSARTQPLLVGTREGGGAAQALTLAAGTFCTNTRLLLMFCCC
jgi:hypothetical protein